MDGAGARGWGRVAGAGPSAFFRTTPGRGRRGTSVWTPERRPRRRWEADPAELRRGAVRGDRACPLGRQPSAHSVRRTPRGAALIPLENWRVGASQWLPSLRGSLHFRAGEVDRIVGPRVVRIFPLNPPKTPGPSGRDPAWRSLCLEGRRGDGSPSSSPLYIPEDQWRAGSAPATKNAPFRRPPVFSDRRPGGGRAVVSTVLAVAAGWAPGPPGGCGLAKRGPSDKL